MKPLTQEAYQLLHDSSLVLARAERNGIHVDVDYCKRATKHLERRLKRMREELNDSEIAEIGRRTYGFKFNIGSDEQLAHILFDVMELESSIKTASGKNSVNAESLQSLHLPALDTHIRIKKLKKAKDTYLANFLKEAVDGYMHPFFNLNSVVSFRSSSSDPNFQNIPNRDPEIRAICRKAIIPRPGRKLGCMDFSSVEVRKGTAYHKDPTMIKYNSDPTTDMHRDMAKEIYMIDDAMWDWIVKETPKNAKMIRHSGKNEFVFPEFYGDWYKSCGPNLYRSAGNDTHILPDGMLLTEWLAKNGMPDYAAFEKHMKEVERAFWYDRFPVYTEWKEKWWNQYLKKGYFDTLTGFRCQGIMDRKQAINYPIQGSAFHATLFSLIEIDKVIEDNQLDSMIIGQIHDECVLDLVVEEEEFLLKECKHIMTKKIREHWKWINVPIDVEIEVTPVDGSWLEKKEIEI